MKLTKTERIATFIYGLIVYTVVVVGVIVDQLWKLVAYQNWYKYHNGVDP